MAKLVTIIGITHNPFMPRLFQQPQQPPGAAKVKERIAMMRQKLADAKPDVLITIGNDHLHQFFMDNMPPFMIGKMDAYDGTFYDETREFLVCRPAGCPATRIYPITFSNGLWMREWISHTPMS